MAVFTDKFLRATSVTRRSGNVVPIFIRVTQIILLGLIGWVVMRAVLLMVSPESAWNAPPQAIPSQISTTGNSSKSFNFTTDPFGVVTSETAQGSQRTVAFDPNLDVPETNLDIKVKGWIAGEFGSASLQTPDNTESSYRVGEEVLDGVSLQAVTPRYIVLDVRGELQRLTFERDDETNLLGEAVDETLQSTVSRRVPQGMTPSNQINSKLDASNLLELVRLNPNFDRGKLTGYVIQSRGDEQVLRQLGLESGDTVTAINGDSLIQGRLDLQELALTLGSTKTVRLDIIRNGKVKTVKVGQ